jgi:hypothetical protein
MSDNPFKDDEPMSVFQETSAKPKSQQPTFKQENPKGEEYLQFPKWDLLPPFKLVKRGKKP